MTDTPRHESDAQSHPSLGSRLTGWKDIAGYLDRGVRTAQRWERDFGLPVRRIGREGAESVFAFTAEIDKWLESNSAARAKGKAAGTGDPESGSASEGDPADAVSGPLSTPGPAQPDRRLLLWLWLLATAVVTLGTTGMWREWSAYRGLTAGLPASWRVEADALVVVDADGRTAWTKRMDFALDEQYYQTQPPGTMGSVADFDNDGKREVLFVAYPANNEWEHAQLYLFNEDGTTRWTYQHRGIVTFGAVTLGGPWLVHRVFVTEHPDAPGTQAIWVASRDPAEFPSLLQRIDIVTGQSVGRYWSNGWVNAVTLWRSPSGPLLLVGGTSNDQRGPSLAVLDANRLHARSPAEQDKYRCVTCSPIDPEAFVVFPRPQRFEASPGSGTVHRFDAGSVTAPVAVMVAYTSSTNGASADAVFRLGEDLQPLSADFADGYSSVYDQLVRDGTIERSGPIPQDATRELLPLKRWQNGKFVPVGRR